MERGAGPAGMLCLSDARSEGDLAASRAGSTPCMGAVLEGLLLLPHSHNPLHPIDHQ